MSHGAGTFEKLQQDHLMMPYTSPPGGLAGPVGAAASIERYPLGPD